MEYSSAWDSLFDLNFICSFTAFCLPKWQSRIFSAISLGFNSMSLWLQLKILEELQLISVDILTSNVEKLSKILGADFSSLIQARISSRDRKCPTLSLINIISVLWCKYKTSSNCRSRPLLSRNILEGWIFFLTNLLFYCWSSCLMMPKPFSFTENLWPMIFLSMVRWVLTLTVICSA